MSTPEETEIQVEETAPERPDWLPSNFNSPEDLAKSYSHATSKITEQGQELSQLRTQVAELAYAQEQAQTQQQQATQTADVEQQLYDAYESGDGRAIAAANAFLVQQAVQQQMAQMQAPQEAALPTEFAISYARDKMALDLSDWSEYEDEVGKIIQGNPVLSQSLAGETNPLRIVESLKTAYELAKYRSGASAADVAAQNATQALDEFNRQNKNSAQTMVGTNSAQEDVSYFDQVKKSNPSIHLGRLP